MRQLSYSFLFTIVFLFSCGGTVADLELGPEYQVYFDLDDPQIVAIARSHGIADTLALTGFIGRIERLSALAPEVMKDPVQGGKMRKEIVEFFLQNHILLQEARSRGIIVDDAEVQKDIDSYKERIGSSEGFEDELESLHMTKSEFTVDTENRLMSQALLKAIRNSIENPSQEELESFIDAQRESIRVSHILFGLDRLSTAFKVDALELLAQSVLDSVKSGNQFSDLASRHSDDGSRGAGGDLGFMRRGQMVDAFEIAAFSLKDLGDLHPKLVQSPFGFHIIKLTDRRTEEAMSKGEARKLLVNQRQRERQSAEISLLKSKASLHLNDDHISDELYQN